MHDFLHKILKKIPPGYAPNPPHTSAPLFQTSRSATAVSYIVNDISRLHVCHCVKVMYRVGQKWHKIFICQ